MLESVMSQFYDIYDILSKRKEMRFVCWVDKDIMAAFIEYSKHFKEASEKASVDKKPTLHLVVPIWYTDSQQLANQT